MPRIELRRRHGTKRSRSIAIETQLTAVLSDWGATGGQKGHESQRRRVLPPRLANAPSIAPLTNPGRRTDGGQTPASASSARFDARAIHGDVRTRSERERGKVQRHADAQ